MALPILIVDDDPDAREMTAKMIQWSGDFEAEMARDVFSALEMVEDHPYALAIIDFRMPGMNGVELFRQMRQIRPELKGILLTGFTANEVIYPAIAAGILRVLAKPIDFDQLLPVIEKHVGTAV